MKMYPRVISKHVEFVCANDQVPTRLRSPSPLWRGLEIVRQALNIRRVFNKDISVYITRFSARYP